jgi:hypothetical protein
VYKFSRAAVQKDIERREREGQKEYEEAVREFGVEGLDHNWSGYQSLRSHLFLKIVGAYRGFSHTTVPNRAYTVRINRIDYEVLQAYLLESLFGGEDDPSYALGCCTF